MAEIEVGKPEWLSRLSREPESKVTEGEFRAVTSQILDENASLYSRGLAVAALGNLIQSQRHLSGKVGDRLGVMDALIELVGRTRAAGDDAGCSEADVHKVRVNCCVVLSMVMESVADGGTKALGPEQSDQGIIPMAPGPSTSQPNTAQSTKATPKKGKGRKPGSRSRSSDSRRRTGSRKRPQGTTVRYRPRSVPSITPPAQLLTDAMSSPCNV